MLTHQRLRHFKSWRDTGPMALGALTGLFGTNSSGKTSLLQFLLLLK
jgi:recombinational DNA repair ATPase RecF